MSASEESQSVRHVRVGADRAGQRLDNFLISHLGQSVPRSLVYRLVRTGQVRVNKSRAKPMQKLKQGDEVRIPPVRLEPSGPVRLPAGLVQQVKSCIIEQTTDFVVIDKPAGLAMHGGSGLSYGLMDAVAEINSDWRPVHRLDRPTSGLLLVACHHQALVALQRAFVERQVDKRYFALLCGRLPEERVRVDEPLKKITDRSGQRRVIVDEDGQRAISEFRLIERLGNYSFVEVSIETGRTHQIRAHARALGLPVAGDELYNEQNPPTGLGRLFLHAHYLSLPWPEPVVFSSPLPDELGSTLDALRQPAHRPR
ncbi:MAG: RluA family pseudouridine synthase [Wenzhouxiangella sp.]